MNDDRWMDGTLRAGFYRSDEREDKQLRKWQRQHARAEAKSLSISLVGIAFWATVFVTFVASLA